MRFLCLSKSTVYMLQSMSKMLDTSRDLLKDLQDSTTTTTTTTAAMTKQLPGKDTAKAPQEGQVGKDKGDGGSSGGGGSGGDAAVTVRPAEEILSGIKGLLRYGDIHRHPPRVCACVCEGERGREGG